MMVSKDLEELCDERSVAREVVSMWKTKIRLAIASLGEIDACLTRRVVLVRTVCGTINARLLPP